MNLFLIAGHSLTDPGAVFNDFRENQLNIEFRDKLYEILQEDYCILRDDDHLSLSKTISWVNKFSKSEDWLIDIHFNAGPATASGAEVFYPLGANAHRVRIAQSLSASLANSMSIPNRGAKPDTLTQHKRLGILRDTIPRALLIEVCFMNSLDLPKYLSNKSAVLDNLAQTIKANLN